MGCSWSKKADAKGPGTAAGGEKDEADGTGGAIVPEGGPRDGGAAAADSGQKGGASGGGAAQAGQSSTQAAGDGTGGTAVGSTGGADGAAGKDGAAGDGRPSAQSQGGFPLEKSFGSSEAEESRRLPGSILKRKKKGKRKKKNSEGSGALGQGSNRGSSSSAIKKAHYKSARVKSVAEINVVLVSDDETEEEEEEDSVSVSSGSSDDEPAKPAPVDIMTDENRRPSAVVADAETAFLQEQADDADDGIRPRAGVFKDSVHISKLRKMEDRQKDRIKDSMHMSKFKKPEVTVPGGKVPAPHAPVIRTCDLAASDAYLHFAGKWMLTKTENMNLLYRAAEYTPEEMELRKEWNFGVGEDGIEITVESKAEMKFQFQAVEKDYEQSLKIDGITQFDLASVWETADSVSEWVSTSSFTQKTKLKGLDIVVTWTLLDMGNELLQTFDGGGVVAKHLYSHLSPSSDTEEAAPSKGEADKVV